MHEILKFRYLNYLGYSLACYESPGVAFDRLRETNPDLFPVPRYYESFWDAIRCVLNQTGF